MTLTTPNVDTDVDTILQEAAPDPVCGVEDCSQPAAWLAVVDCGHDGLWCAEHCATFERLTADGWTLRCKGAGHPSEEPRTIVRWIAL